MAKEEVRVVVVDDDAESAATLREWLELNGYSVGTAADANEALALVAEQQPMCVLLDLGLPGIDGYELARRLRIEHGTALVLVAVTGHGGERDRLNAEDAGIDFVCVKPLDANVLLQILPPIV